MVGRKLNDLNLSRWKEYFYLNTDSLWLLGERNPSDGQGGEYHGLFHPEIPRQLLQRYTRRGDWVLDCFFGSGTTGVEAGYLGRHCMGLEINPVVVHKTQARVQAVAEKTGTQQLCLKGDATDEFFWDLVRTAVSGAHNAAGPLFQFLMLHPPYHNIVKFSDEPNDLSCCPTVEDFLRKLEVVIENAVSVLDPGRYGALVVGDIYLNGEVFPLASECQRILTRCKQRLKGIVVKDFGETRGKANQHALWRYRCLKNGNFRFRHETIFVFENGRSK